MRRRAKTITAARAAPTAGFGAAPAAASVLVGTATGDHAAGFSMVNTTPCQTPFDLTDPRPGAG